MAKTGLCEMCNLLNNIVLSSTKLRAQGSCFEFREQVESQLDARLKRLRRYVHRLPPQSSVRRGAESVKRTLQQLLDEQPLYADKIPLPAVLEEVDRFLFLAENEQERHVCSNCVGGGRPLADICDDILQQFVDGDLPTARRCIRELMETKTHESTWESIPWDRMPALK